MERRTKRAAGPSQGARPLRGGERSSLGAPQGASPLREASAAFGDQTTDLGFAYRVHKTGEVTITRDGRTVTVLRGDAARDFDARIAVLTPEQRQAAMARITGTLQARQRAARRATPAQS